MNRLEGLEPYFEQHIKPTLGRFPLMMKLSQYLVGIMLIAFVALLFGVMPEVSGPVAALGFIAMLLSRKSIASAYRNKIVIPLMGQLGEAFSFSYEGGIDEQELRNSKLLNFIHMHKLEQKKHTRFKEAGRSIEMVDVMLEQQYNDADNKPILKRHCGLFVAAPTQLNITGTTLIVPDLAERIAGDAGKAVQNQEREALPIIRLDSPEFEKHFIVYGSDTTQAHYLLNYTVMEAMTKTAQKFPFRLSFCAQHIYVFIDLAGGWLEPQIGWEKRPMASFEGIKEHFEMMDSIIDLIHTIEAHHLLRAPATPIDSISKPA